MKRLAECQSLFQDASGMVSWRVFSSIGAEWPFGP